MNLLSLKFALKNLFSKNNSSLISILGLAIAFCSVLYIYSYVTFELGYDSQHKKADRIYRISGDIVASENTMTHAVLGPLMGSGLKDDFPAVEAFVRLFPIHRSILFETEAGQFSVDEAYTADCSVFDVFTFNFVYGDEKTALVNPFEIVINQSLSLKLFGNKNPLGALIKNGDQTLTVCGVVTDSPKNSHHKLNVLFSDNDPLKKSTGLSDVQLSEGYWMPSAFHFILLYPNTKIESITENFKPFFDKHMVTFGQAINAKFNPVVIPLRDLHFSRHMSYDYPKGNKTYTYILILAGIFILSIAIINYSNLLISQNITQAKNIGIKKIIGATQPNLFLQFLSNSLLFIFTALILANVIFYLSVSYGQKITGIDSTTYSTQNILILSFILLLILGFITSLIPFFNQLTKKGLELIHPFQNYSLNRGSLKFGKLSTILQYSLSMVLIISAFFISRQLNFFVNSDMGFDKENVVLLKLSNTANNIQNTSSFQDELRKNPLVADVAFSTNVPGDVMGTKHLQIERDGQKVTKIIGSMGVGYNYVPLMGMELKDGRNFAESFSDGNGKSVMVNEAFIDFCGFSGSIPGIQLEGTTVVGVLKNVCFNSLHNPTEPMAFYLSNEPRGYINIKLKTSNTKEALNSIQTTWKEFFKEEPFEIQFLDNRISMMYAEDQKKSSLVQFFTLICLVISIMGLLNLSSIIMKRKTKDIGIRRVNGARIFEIFTMLNTAIVKWVVLAFVIATPLSWFAMHLWLENFAYKTDLSWWIFALAGLLALGIALLTVSYQTFKAAVRNPIESLRYE